MSESPDIDLVLRYQAGDEEAYRALFERHERALRGRLASRLPALLRRRIAVSDVIQETCVIAYERREDFEARGPNAFRNWLMGIADKKLKEAIRRHGGAARRSAAREVSRAGRPDTGLFFGERTSPSAAAMSAEVATAIREALDRLPEDYAQVLRLAFVDGLNLKEASERMGRSHAATRKLYGRALVSLRGKLTDAEVDRGDE